MSHFMYTIESVYVEFEFNLENYYNKTVWIVMFKTDVIKDILYLRFLGVQRETKILDTFKCTLNRPFQKNWILLEMKISIKVNL